MVNSVDFRFGTTCRLQHLLREHEFCSALPLASYLLLLEDTTRAEHTVADAGDSGENGAAARVQRSLQIFFRHATSTEHVPTRNNR